MIGLVFEADKIIEFAPPAPYLGQIGKALYYTIKDQKAKSATSHELMLSYQLPVNPGSGKKVVRTPRYRH